MRAKDASVETVDDYKKRILEYQAGADPLVLQAKAPDVLAALIEGLSTEDLELRPAPGKWCIRESSLTWLMTNSSGPIVFA